MTIRMLMRGVVLDCCPTTFRRSRFSRLCLVCGKALVPGTHGFIPWREAFRGPLATWCRACGLAGAVKDA